MADHYAVDANVLIRSVLPDTDDHLVAQEVAVGATHVIGIVVTETWSVLRRHFKMSSDRVGALLDAHLDGRRLLGTPDAAYRQVLASGPALNLAGNIHDATILEVAAAHDLTIVTLDRGVARLGAGRVPVRLLPDDDPTT